MVDANLVTKADDVVFYIGDSASLCPSDGGTTQPTPDHLAVQHNGIGRSSNEHFVGIWGIEPSRKNPIIAQDLYLTVLESINDVLSAVLDCSPVDMCGFNPEIGEQGHDEP